MAEVFLCNYRRTPIGRYGGALAHIRTDDLAALPLRALLAELPGLDAAAVDEVVLGCANQAGEDNRNVARMAALLAGLPDSVPGMTVNRLCASGLDAVITGARAIAAGQADLVIAGGVESMSRAPLVMPKADTAFSRRVEIYDTTIGWRFVNAAMEAAYGTDSMPETAENLAKDHGISRADQDAYALRAQARAAAGSGLIAEELTPAPGRKPDQAVQADEHPRPDTTAAQLAGLRSITGREGSITAGNAAGVNDGAAALVLASAAAVERYGLAPRARVLGAASAGVAPRIMGIGPVAAQARLKAQTGLGIGDYDLIELNEAFAAQVLAVTRAWGLADDDPRVNPHGGAIALGHPLGMSGARLAGRAALDVAAGRAQRALVTLCVGVGQGVALALGAP